jgi:hypothetical protein
MPRIMVEIDDPESLRRVMAALERKQPWPKRPWPRMVLACLAAAAFLVLLAVALTFAREKTLGVRVLTGAWVLATVLAAAYAYTLGYEKGLRKAGESGPAPANVGRRCASCGREIPGRLTWCPWCGALAPRPEPAAPEPRVVGVSLWERVVGSPWAWGAVLALALLALVAALAFHAALKAKGWV